MRGKEEESGRTPVHSVLMTVLLEMVYNHDKAGEAALKWGREYCSKTQASIPSKMDVLVIATS